MEPILTPPYCAEAELLVIDTHECRQRLDELTAYENSHFGEKFQWSAELNEYWASTSAGLHAAIVEDGPVPQIVASMSLLLVDPATCKQLVAGDIKECELRPWNHGYGCQRPVLYFASVIAHSKAFLPALYASLAHDTSEMLKAFGLEVEEGLAIAAGDAGRQHLERNGFRRMGTQCYLDEHPFMGISARSAQSTFWRRILSPSMRSKYPSQDYLLSTRSPFFS